MYFFKCLFLFLFLYFPLFVFAQATIFIESEEFGRGFLKPRATECYAIVPLHVVDSNEKEIKIVGEKNVVAVGKLVQSTSSDLAIVKSINGGELYCEDWVVDGNYDRILSNAIEGVIEIRLEDGGSKLMQVFISEKNESNITIEPKRDNQSFVKGMSGSTLFAIVNGEKKSLGMLLEVDVDKREGYVLQMDDIVRNIEGFFDLKRSQKTAKTMEDIKNNGVKSLANSKYKVFTKDNVSIQLISCKQEDKKVKCLMKVISKSKDQEIGLHAIHSVSRLYDEQGNEYQSRWVRLTNSSHNFSVKKKLISDVPIEAEIVFDVGRDISLITKLEIHFEIQRNKYVPYWRTVELE